MFVAESIFFAYLGITRLEQKTSQLPSLANVAVGSTNPPLVAGHAGIADDSLQNEDIFE